MTRVYVAVGDLVDAEYVADTYGTIRTLRGVVGYVGEWEGKVTTSVYAVGSSTSQSTMPVHLVARAGSDEARAVAAELLRHGRVPERVRTRIELAVGTRVATGAAPGALLTGAGSRAPIDQDGASAVAFIERDHA